MYVSDGKRKEYKRETKKKRRVYSEDLMSTFSNLKMFLTLKILTSTVLVTY